MRHENDSLGLAVDSMFDGGQSCHDTLQRQFCSSRLQLLAFACGNNDPETDGIVCDFSRGIEGNVEVDAGDADILPESEHILADGLSGCLTG